MKSSHTSWTFPLALVISFLPAIAWGQGAKPGGNSQKAPTDAQLRNWVNILDQGHWPSRDKARGKLRSNAIAAVPFLFERLKSPQCKTPGSLTATLGFIGADNAKAAKIILSSLDHEDSKIRIRLLGVFNYFRGRQPELIVPWIAKNLGDKNDGVCLILAGAAAYHGAQGKILVPALVPLLNRQNVKLKARVLMTLRGMSRHLGQYTPKIEALRNDKNPELRIEVMEIFHILNPKTENRLQLWRGALKDESVSIKRAACRNLAAMGSDAESTSSELLKLCSSADSRLRFSAVSALGLVSKKTKDKAILVECFSKALGDSNTKVRENAAKSLGLMGPAAKSAVPLLIEGLKHKEAYSYLPYHSAEALGRIGEKELSIPALRLALKTKQGFLKERIKKSLAALGVKVKSTRASKYDPKLSSLVESLETKGRYYHRDAVLETAKHGSSIVPLLLKQWEILDISMMRLIRDTLIEIGQKDAAAVPLIAKQLKDPFVGRRKKALEVLTEIGVNSKSALKAIVEAVDDSDAQVCWRALKCLGQLGPESLPALLANLSHPNLYRQRGSAKALAVVKGDSKAVRKALIGQISHSDDAIRGHIIQALGTKDPVDGDVIPALIKALGDGVSANRIVASRALKAQGLKAKAALAKLAELIRADKVLDARINGIRAYAKISNRDEKTGQVLADTFLKVDEAKLKQELLRAMAEARAPVKSVLTCVKKTMKDWNQLDWRWINYCLSHYADASKEAMNILLGLLKHKNKDVRINVLRELKRLKKHSAKAVKAVEECCSDDDSWVRSTAQSTLENLAKLKN